ncbi:MAG: hemophore-related protein [Mycobacterium sp.]
MSNFAHGRWVPLRVVQAAAVGVAVGVVALATGSAAGAQPPGDQCSPAAMMRAHGTAMTQMADYLDARPDVQQALTNARSMPTSQERQAAMNDYNAAHPDVAAAFQNMHQPVANLMTTCGLSMDQTMMMPGNMMMMPGSMTTPGGQMTPGDPMTPGGMMAPSDTTPGQ